MLGTNHGANFPGPGIAFLDWVTVRRVRNIVGRRDVRVLEVYLERINSSVSQRTRVTQFTTSYTGRFDLKIQKRGFCKLQPQENGSCSKRRL